MMNKVYELNSLEYLGDYLRAELHGQIFHEEDKNYPYSATIRLEVYANNTRVAVRGFLLPFKTLPTDKDALLATLLRRIASRALDTITLAEFYGADSARNAVILKNAADTWIVKLGF